MTRGVRRFNMSLLPLSYISPIGCQIDHDSTSEEELLALHTQIIVRARVKVSANLLENNDEMTN